MNIKQAILKAVRAYRTRLFKASKSGATLDTVDELVRIVENTKIKPSRRANVR